MEKNFLTQGLGLRTWKGSVKRREPDSPAPHQKKVSTLGLIPTLPAQDLSFSDLYGPRVSVPAHPRPTWESSWEKSHQEGKATALALPRGLQAGCVPRGQESVTEGISSSKRLRGTLEVQE